MAIQEAVPGRLGAYRLLDRIGEGGMGVVHLAADKANRLVAVKVLRAQDSPDRAARRRLEREVESMCRVRSPFVPEVIDADLTCDVPYLVTRFVPGRPLSQVVTEDGPLTGARLQRLAYGLAEALAAAHAVGVVHRDLKPGNVMMNGDDPLVIDFGIAELPDATPLTRTGIIIGTPGYLAPEVIEGQSCQPASDVHSWAATVGFAARGKPVYGTGSYEAVLARILRGDADLEGIPGPLYPLIAAALLRRASQRPSAAWLASQVARLDLTAPGPPPTLGAFPARAPAAAARGRAVLQPEDFAGLLPPVRQGSDLTGKQPAGAVERSAADGAGRGSRSRRRRVLSCAAILAAATLSFKLTVAGTAAAAAALVLLNAAGFAREGLAGRRAGGSRRASSLRLAASIPGALARALLVLLASTPLLLVLACLPAAALVFWLGRSHLLLALACAAGTYTLLNCLAPASGPARREWHRLIGALTPTWLTRIAVAFALVIVATGAVLAALVSGPSFWPSPGPASVLQLTQVHHVASTQRVLSGGER